MKEREDIRKSTVHFSDYTTTGMVKLFIPMFLVLHVSQPYFVVMETLESVMMCIYSCAVRGLLRTNARSHEHPRPR